MKDTWRPERATHRAVQPGQKCQRAEAQLLEQWEGERWRAAAQSLKKTKLHEAKAWNGPCQILQHESEPTTLTFAEIRV